MTLALLPRPADPDAALSFVLDGGGSAIAAGAKPPVQIPSAYTVVGWDIVGDGNIVVNVNRATYAGLPAFTSIAGAEKPTLAGVTKNQDTGLTTWTTALAAHDWIQFAVEGTPAATYATVSLRLRRT